MTVPASLWLVSNGSLHFALVGWCARGFSFCPAAVLQRGGGHPQQFGGRQCRGGYSGKGSGAVAVHDAVSQKAQRQDQQQGHTLQRRPHATLKRRVVVSRVNLSATSGRAFRRAVVSILEEVTAFHVILYSPA